MISKLAEHSPNRSHGFILVTSLVFLVVITLLAVSAMNSTTVQERMASNLREKSRARQAADAGLRHAELQLASPAFDKLPALYDCNPSTASTEPATSSAIRVCHERSMLQLEQTPGNPLYKTFLDQAVWNNPAVAIDSDDRVGDREITFFVEAIQHQFNGADLNPDRAAVGDGGVYYRITTRAHGENQSAIAVTQSIYEKNY